MTTGPETLDKPLAEALGPAVAGALTRWADAMGVSYQRPLWFTNGRSGAMVAAVYERGRSGGAQRLILKYEPAGGPNEYTRMAQAWQRAPAFARTHLPSMKHDPVEVGDDAWILFQELAGADLTRYRVLTALLAGVAHSGVDIRGGIEPVPCDRHAFARVCAEVTAGILGGLAGPPDLEPQPASVFLESHFAERTGPGKRLRHLAADRIGPTLRLPGEPRPLTNPFRFVFDPPAFLTAEVPAIVGRAHGDLHTENILVRTDPAVDGADFYLVDLARYHDRAPLTADPVQLVLSVVNRCMSELSAPQRELLLDALATGATGDTSMLPAWLTDLLTRQRDTVDAWLGPSGLGPEWRALLPLSTLGGALIFLARSTTPAENAAWFLRLAARCAARVEAELGS